MVSMDAEVTAVIKKNSKNNNTKGCVKVMEKLPQRILFVLPDKRETTMGFPDDVIEDAAFVAESSLKKQAKKEAACEMLRYVLENYEEE